MFPNSTLYKPQYLTAVFLLLASHKLEMSCCSTLFRLVHTLYMLQHFNLSGFSPQANDVRMSSGHVIQTYPWAPDTIFFPFESCWQFLESLKRLTHRPHSCLAQFNHHVLYSVTTSISSEPPNLSHNPAGMWWRNRPGKQESPNWCSTWCRMFTTLLVWFMLYCCLQHITACFTMSHNIGGVPISVLNFKLCSPGDCPRIQTQDCFRVTLFYSAGFWPHCCVLVRQ